MKPRDVEKLVSGLYRLFWAQHAGGGYSLAAVGSTYDGTRWYAPTNWTARNAIDLAGLIATDWSRIERVELIRSRDGQNMIDVAVSAALTELPDPDIAAVIRDAFLCGDDKTAIGLLASALNMTQRGSGLVADTSIVELVQRLVKFHKAYNPQRDQDKGR